jgi:hypothetical protein
LSIRYTKTLSADPTFAAAPDGLHGLTDIPEPAGRPRLHPARCRLKWRVSGTSQQVTWRTALTRVVANSSQQRVCLGGGNGNQLDAARGR